MACLIVTAGPGSGTHFPLGQHRTVAVGRDDQCTFQILDPKVSRQHLQIRLGDDGKHYAADYRSANGVKVNGTLITQDAPLKDRDSIQIGGTTIVYSAADFATAAAAAAAMRGKDEWKRSTLIHD